MSEWKEYKLGEIVSFGNGKERPKDKGSIPVYGGNGILDYANIYNYDGETIIIGRVGAYCGSVYYTNIPVWVSDNALAAKPVEGNDAKFVYYYLQNLNLNDFAEGSSHPLVTQRLLNSIDVKIPSDGVEQKRIASILSSLDDKIDLLNHENVTLEAMAEALFRQWFIEEAKEDWKEISLGELIDISSGKGLPRKEFAEDGLYSVFGANGEIGRTNKCLIDSEEKLIFTGRVGTLGNVFRLENESAWLSDNTLIIRPKDYYYFVYFVLKLAHLQDYNVGSTQPLIRQTDIKEIELSMPNESILSAFEAECKTLYKKITYNTKQIKLLTKQRDMLLPKLMSNEIAI